MIIRVLFILIFFEMAVILSSIFKTSLREVVPIALDQVKRGRAPVLLKTLSGTILVVMISRLYIIMRIQSLSIHGGIGINPVDQILLAKHMLEAILMGVSLFLALIVDRLHHYIRELLIRRKSQEAATKQGRGPDNGKSGASEEIRSLRGGGEITLGEKLKQLESELEQRKNEADIRQPRKSQESAMKQSGGSEDCKACASEQIKALQEETNTLKGKIKELVSKLDEKKNEADAAEALSSALRKQSQGLSIEYDGVLEENQRLIDRLQMLGGDQKQK